MRLTTTSIALLALPAFSHAVKLEDFVPRVTDVSSGCRKVYEQELPGCTPDDFTKQSCSASCVHGLVSMTKPVKDACGNDGLLTSGEQSNILVLFLTGKGPENLCKNAETVLNSPSSSSAEPSTTATPTPTSSSESTAAESTTAASSSDVPTSILMDTSSSSGATSTSSDASASSTGTSQIFEAPSMPPSTSSTAASSQQTDGAGHSGGGSPFDAEGNEFSGASAASSSAGFFAAAVAFAILAAQR